MLACLIPPTNRPSRRDCSLLFFAQSVSALRYNIIIVLWNKKALKEMTIDMEREVNVDEENSKECEQIFDDWKIFFASVVFIVLRA